MRSIRKQRAISRADLAALTALSYETIGNVERGDFKPRRSTLDLIALALGIPVAELTGEDDV